MKKNVYMIIVAIFLSLGLAACSSDSQTTTKGDAVTSESSEPLTDSEFKKMLSNPDQYKGSKVVFYGTVFVDPEKDDNGTYLQVFDKNDNNLIIAIEDPNLEVEVDDIVKVKGAVKGVFEGENAFGATIEAPAISAVSVEVTDYATAFAPAIQSIEVNEKQEQSGYVITLEKVEIAEKETRAYISITNDSQDQINFYSFNSKLIIGSDQYEENDGYHYPDIPSEILPGVTVKGIVAFPAIDKDVENLKFHFEGYSENYDIEIEPFNFTVKNN